MLSRCCIFHPEDSDPLLRMKFTACRKLPWCAGRLQYSAHYRYPRTDLTVKRHRISRTWPAPAPSTCSTATQTSSGDPNAMPPCANMLRGLPHRLEPVGTTYSGKNAETLRVGGRGRPADAGDGRTQRKAHLNRCKSQPGPRNLWTWSPQQHPRQDSCQ